jgi:hypothetical protein
VRPQQDIGGTGPWPDSLSAWTIPCNLWAIERVLLVFNRCVENREACFQKERGRCGERESSEYTYARSNSLDSELHCGRDDFKTCYDFMYGLFQFKLFRESFFCWTSVIACIFLKEVEMPGTCASPIISNNKQIRSPKNQCFKVKCPVRSTESFVYFVYSFFFCYFTTLSATRAVWRWIVGW